MPNRNNFIHYCNLIHNLQSGNYVIHTKACSAYEPISCLESLTNLKKKRILKHLACKVLLQHLQRCPLQNFGMALPRVYVKNYLAKRIVPVMK